MNGRAKGREGDLLARQDWTERLRRFSIAGPGKPREDAIEAALKLSPGGALRDMLRAYGSSRGRRRKGSSSEKTARERLESTLNEIFGKDPTPVPSLYAKLAGRIETSVTDALRIVAALIQSWPEPLGRGRGGKSRKDETSPISLAESFIRELLAEISAGRSREWTESEMEVLVFRLVDEKRVGVKQFIKTAGEEEGALIVSGAKRILLGGDDPVGIIRQFHSVTNEFIDQGHKGVLIFVFNSSIFEAGKEGFNLLYNQGLLATAMIAFALFPENYDFSDPIQETKVDWGKWRTLSRRCCVVIRKPPLIDTSTGQFLKQPKFDDFISSWRPTGFDQLAEVQGFFRFDSSHVLPRTYPSQFGPSLLGKELYWDVVVHPTQNHPDLLEVQYYVPPNQDAAMALDGRDEESGIARAQKSGRRSAIKALIEEDYFYLVQYESPGASYDDAQRAIYRAARGRLNLDTGEAHMRNLNFAAALRQVGFEVFPISVLLSLFSRMLELAAAVRSD